MLDVKFVRENMEAIEAKIKERKLSIELNDFIQIEGDYRRLLSENEQLRHLKNRTSERIAELKRARQDAGNEISEMKKVSQQIKSIDDELRSLKQKLDMILYNIPNIPHSSVPVGNSEDDNVLVRSWGELPQFDFEPLPHWDIGENLSIIDFSMASKITGARFSILSGPAALLERALVNYMLDIHTREHGFREISPPLIVNRNAMIGTGQLPHLEEDLFKLDNSDYFLIPTAEVPLTNLHREQILDESQLPIYYVAHTPCFRREAGSYGKDTRGLIRQHQFHKVELVKIVRPEDSYEELETLLVCAETILQRLELPYRVMLLCSADLSFSASKCYDLEVWLPSQNRYREISSCSNFEDYQARRSDIRYRPSDSNKTEFVHTLNASGLAIGRTLLAILENFQQPNGTVRIPKPLQPYMHGLEVIAADPPHLSRSYGM